jgi:hypothetical protein
MKKQNTIFTFNFYLFTLYSLCLGVFVVENISIKNNKLCETKPISDMPKMTLTSCSTMTNNKKQRTINYQKQTQTKPIQSQFKPKTKPKQTQSNPILPAPLFRVSFTLMGSAFYPPTVGRRIQKARFRFETLRIFVEDDGFGWAEEFVFYSTPNNGSAEGRRNNKEQHQERP